METYYLGWDVGSWHCKSSSESRDVIAILNNDQIKFTKPGNIRESILTSESTRAWLESIFKMANSDLPSENYKIIMAIDATLGFSTAFVDLINNTGRVNEIESFRTNSYLFRETEKRLYQRNKEIKALSAVQDRIGSQATKAMHARSKFAPKRISTGVWTSADGTLTIIETYPASVSLPSAIKPPNYDDKDMRDAQICAHVAYLFDKRIDLLWSPDNDIPESEGWIWTACK